MAEPKWTEPFRSFLSRVSKPGQRTNPGADAPRQVRIVTDSTGYLPAELISHHRIHVVPLEVVVGGKPVVEGSEFDGAKLAAVLRGRTKVSTSRPSPARFLTAYEKLAKDGAGHVISLHISSEVSGTVEAASLAATVSPVPVTVIDTGQLGMGLGFSVLAAALAAERGLGPEEVAQVGRTQAAATQVFFYVDTLDYLRRGGRIGRAQALLGSALAVKPLLGIDQGKVHVVEKVRTSAKALSRMVERATSAIPGALRGQVEVDLVVHHLAAHARASQVAEQIASRLPSLRDHSIIEVGPVIGAHVGPGMVAVVITPAIDRRSGAERRSGWMPKK